MVIFAGGTLIKRMGEGFEKQESFFDTLDAVTNGRLWMTLFSLETIKDNPIGLVISVVVLIVFTIGVKILNKRQGSKLQ